MIFRGWIIGLSLLLAACETAPMAPFDPDTNERIGGEVDEACFGNLANRTGRYIRINDRNGYVIRGRDTDYLLVFSGGCGDLGGLGSVPVFRNYGDNCRRRGELVNTAGDGFRITGGCTVQHIYEWREEAEVVEETESE